MATRKSGKVRQYKSRDHLNPIGEETTYDIDELREKYGISHQAVSGAVRATKSTNRQMLEDYLEKKRTIKTRARRFVQSVR
jgi:hypothetical protein